MIKTISMMLSLLAIMMYWISCTGGQANQPADNPPPTDTIVQTDTAAQVMTDTVMSDTAAFKITIDYVMGRFNPAEHPDFVKIPIEHADKEGMYLRKDAYNAFLKMAAHAKRDGITLQIRSAARNFNAQKGIWEGKWTGTRLLEGGENLAQTTPDPKERALKILRYSSMPGSSRHHWGTDIDLNNLNNSWFAEGEGLRMYEWLVANAAKYGYCQTYTAGRPHGYWEERWHWSYTPVSSKITQYARMNLRNEMIDGFLGSETAGMIDIVKHYVLGINEACNH
jgi:D-alanyl-D-alanine carboxypeptidase